MNKNLIKPFTMKVKEIFRFSDGSTVFAGTITDGGEIITPCEVEVLLDGRMLATIHLQGERMSGPKLPPDYRIVFTKDELELENTVEKERYTLVCRGSA